MTDEHKSTRLGDLLVEQGIITRLQLAHVVELQEVRRQHAIKVNAPNSYTQELGELLIELGFINRSQLKSSLSWQKRLRKTTAVMVFIAPLLTVACGGGGSGGTGSNTQAPPSSSQTVSSDKPTSSSASASLAPEENTTSVSSSLSSLPPVSSSSFSSRPSSASSASSNSSVINGAVQVYWRPPKQRLNGDFLDITELAGYELRYKRKSDTRYTSIIIDDAYVDAYYFNNLEGEYEFQLAAFDVNGIYSTFVPIQPR